MLSCSVGPVRLNSLERGYICSDSDVLQNAVEWWGVTWDFPHTWRQTCIHVHHSYTYTHTTTIFKKDWVTVCQASVVMLHLGLNINTGQRAYWQPDKESEKVKLEWPPLIVNYSSESRQLCAELCTGLEGVRGVSCWQPWLHPLALPRLHLQLVWNIL